MSLSKNELNCVASALANAVPKRPEKKKKSKKYDANASVVSLSDMKDTLTQYEDRIDMLEETVELLVSAITEATS